MFVSFCALQTQYANWSYSSAERKLGGRVKPAYLPRSWALESMAACGTVPSRTSMKAEPQAEGTEQEVCWQCCVLWLQWSLLQGRSLNASQHCCRWQDCREQEFGGISGTSQQPGQRVLPRHGHSACSHQWDVMGTQGTLIFKAELTHCLTLCMP